MTSDSNDEAGQAEQTGSYERNPQAKHSEYLKSCQMLKTDGDSILCVIT